MKKKIAILGSTGSIGESTVKILNNNKKNIKIDLLSTNKNVKKIYNQAKKFNVKKIVVHNHETFKKYKFFFKKKKIKIYQNVVDYLKDNKKTRFDYTMSSISGLEGLIPTLEIIKVTNSIAIANKESIICGWSLIKKELKKYKTNFIPVDSEHFSILKLINHENKLDIKKIFITASGGPFLNHNLSKLKNIKPREALKHPKWRMGKKISIDSATLMNKVFEIVEAQKLFSIPDKKIDILIHPNSLVHAIIYFKNGLVKFLYHETSMIIPLANAIFDGKLNIECFYKSAKNSKSKIAESLIFKNVDKKKFPLIKLKNEISKYPSTPIIINAANEVLVNEFLKNKIPYMDINRQILSILNDSNYRKYAIKKPKTLKEILKIDSWAKSTIKNKI